MKRNLFLSLLIVFFTTSFILLIGCNNQTPTKEQSSVSQKKVDYELQEKCGKQSKEYFSKEYENGTVKTKDGTISTYYTNHYNKKQNKCFLLLRFTHIYNNKKKGYSYSEKLWDINENNKYGFFVENGKNNLCFVLDKECKSEEEWNSLVKPYMEE